MLRGRRRLTLGEPPPACGASPRPTVVVVLPSPAGVGLIRGTGPHGAKGSHQKTAEGGVQAGRPLMAPSVTMSIRQPGDEEEGRAGLGRVRPRTAARVAAGRALVTVCQHGARKLGPHHTVWRADRPALSA